MSKKASRQKKADPKADGRQYELEFVWHDITIKMRRVLPLSDMFNFVESVVDSCFTSSGEFVPQFRTFALESEIVSAYTDYTLPDDVEERYSFLSGTDIITYIVGNIDSEIQLNNMIKCVDEKIIYLRDSKARELRAQVESLMGVSERIVSSLEDVLGNLSHEDIEKLVNAIDEVGKVDESKIVKAYMSEVKPTRAKRRPKGAVSAG